MKLYAISDLHVNYAKNRQLMMAMPLYREDWLILAGDIGENEMDLHFVLSILTKRFAQVIWTPGNHDLWTVGYKGVGLRGDDKYRSLVSICRSYGVQTPEDPYLLWTGDGGPCIIAPLFTLYDYSFRPPTIPFKHAVAWAEERGQVCSDEYLLHPDPYISRTDWCIARCIYTEARLQEVSSELPTVLISHFPLREDLVRLPRIPRFALWCGTQRTTTWHKQYRAKVVVYGHIHMRSTDYRDNVRFEEVSLGYPGHWHPDLSIQSYLREILPGPDTNP